MPPRRYPPQRLAGCVDEDVARRPRRAAFFLAILSAGALGCGAVSLGTQSVEECRAAARAHLFAFDALERYERAVWQGVHVSQAEKALDWEWLELERPLKSLRAEAE